MHSAKLTLTQTEYNWDTTTVLVMRGIQKYQRYLYKLKDWRLAVFQWPRRSVFASVYYIQNFDSQKFHCISWNDHNSLSLHSTENYDLPFPITVFFSASSNSMVHLQLQGWGILFMYITDMRFSWQNIHIIFIQKSQGVTVDLISLSFHSKKTHAVNDPWF